MMKDLSDLVIQSITRPRKAMRAVIDRVDGIEGVTIIMGLAIAVNALMLVLVDLFTPAADQLGAGVVTMLTLVQSVAAFMISTLLVKWVGRLFGGKGDLLEIATMVAWYSLISSVLLPIAIAAGPMLKGGAIHFNLLHLVSGILAMWLLANYIAEAHRFQSAARVAGVMLGLVLAPSLLLVLMRA